jgi:hypothetical protein
MLNPKKFKKSTKSEQHHKPGLSRIVSAAAAVNLWPKANAVKIE